MKLIEYIKNSHTISLELRKMLYLKIYKLRELMAKLTFYTKHIFADIRAFPKKTN